MDARRRILLGTLAAGGMAMFGAPARGQDKYPSRPLRLIVPHPTGGGVDIPARSLAEGMRPILGQSLVVENKPGAGGTIGAQMAAVAPPDGYTLLMSSVSEAAIAPYLYKGMTYDPVKDLQPITLVVKAPNVLVVGPSTSAQNVAELIAAAAAKPGALTCGTSGVGSIQHLNLELFNKMAGVKIAHVPYKGSAPQNTDLMGGQINMGYASVIGVLPLIKAGKLRAIAVTSRERVQALPGVPALTETPALAGYDLNNWNGLFAPAGVPQPILQTLHAAAVQVLGSPQWQTPILETGAIPAPGTPEQFAAYIASESKKFGAIIKETNITLES
jgi:tripartite-type tricarboxylate transporter receptor subunit TctC